MQRALNRSLFFKEKKNVFYGVQFSVSYLATEFLSRRGTSSGMQSKPRTRLPMVGTHMLLLKAASFQMWLRRGENQWPVSGGRKSHPHTHTHTHPSKLWYTVVVKAQKYTGYIWLKIECLHKHKRKYTTLLGTHRYTQQACSRTTSDPTVVAFPHGCRLAAIKPPPPHFVCPQNSCLDWKSRLLTFAVKKTLLSPECRVA